MMILHHKVGYWLVGRLLRRSPFNLVPFRRVIGQIWRTKQHFDIRNIERNLFSFRLATEAVSEYVIKDSPWTFDRCTVVLKTLDIDESPSQVVLTAVPFWV